ncbi:MAG TPA: phosphoglycerol transferase I [Scandinavium sp.]|jgi:phosphoglycerol transferase
MIYIQFFLLFALSLATSRWVIIKSIATSIIFLLFAFWFISDMFTGYGVTDAVYYQLFNSTQGTSLHDIYSKIEIGILFVIIIFSTLCLSFYFKKNKINILKIKYINYIWTLTFLSLLCSPFISNIYNSAKDTFFNQGDASAVQNEYKNINGNLNKKYNYVFIYAESLERTFKNLDGKNHLPGLSSIASQYLEFTDIRQPLSRGMGWTMAGMVNTQCGIPLVIEQGNSGANFSKFLGKADCVATWLEKQGYQTEFIRGSQKEFAGGDKFLEQHGWQSQHDRSYFVSQGLVTPNDISGWGIHDDVMLNHAWDEFSRMSASKQPFLLSFLTVNTHAPSGTFLNICDDHVSRNEQYPMLASVECSDYLLTKFINRITESPWFDNTIIVLVSDHLMMANDATPLLSNIEQQRRNHFIIIKKGLQPAVNNTEGTLLDVWPTVLDVSGSTIKEVGFGTSLLDSKPGRFIKGYALGRTKDYLAYASQLWGYPSLNEGIKQIPNGIRIGSQEYTLPVFASLDSNNQIKGLWFEAFALNAKKMLTNSNIFYANLCKNIGINENGICSYIISKNSIRKMRINPTGTSSNEIINKPTVFLDNNILGLSVAPFTMSSGGVVNDQNITLGFGFNLISLNPDQTGNVLALPTCTSNSIPSSDVTTFLENHHQPVIFASNDSAVCNSTAPIEQLAKNLNAPELSNLKFRQQVIGVYNSGHTNYIKGIPGLSLDVFIDIKNYSIIPLCKALSDCN